MPRNDGRRGLKVVQNYGLPRFRKRNLAMTEGGGNDGSGRRNNGGGAC
ncbi:hypothetical protein [Helicobacter sp.]|nr:hypothetical protein [Helicobacter sp.]MDY5557915.1 hypothetical protein [Helicobacter sp.]